MADNFEPLLSISEVEHGEFVALDIGALSKVNPDQDEPTPSQPVSVLKSLSRIRSGGERERRAAEGEMTNSAGGGSPARRPQFLYTWQEMEITAGIFIRLPQHPGGGSAGESAGAPRRGSTQGGFSSSSPHCPAWGH